MKFFKISKTKPEKTTTYIRYGDAPEGNTVVCIAKKEEGDKKVLLKRGDIDGNESLYCNPNSSDNQMDAYDDKPGEGLGVEDAPESNKMGVAPQDFEAEIEPHEEEFAISREIFCAEIVHDVDPNCTPKYNRYYDTDTNALLIGPDFINNFRSWKSSYHYENQTIFGFKITATGLIDFPGQDEVPAQLKRIRGLGVCAVLLAVLGKEDRGGENWGLIDKYNHLQVVLIDFGRCLSSMMFTEEESNKFENTFTNPFDLIKAVFQQYNAADEPPLPASFFESAHIKYEIFETIEKLHTMPAASWEKRAEDNFKQFPVFKKAILHDKRKGIEHLYNQFKDNKEYIATTFINECLERTGALVTLSELDNEAANYLQSLYNYVRPHESSLRKELFFKQIQNVFKPESLCENHQPAPQSM